MEHLLRRQAPLSDAGWGLIDEEARQHLQTALAGRKLVDFAGPKGYDHAARNLGRVEDLPGAPAEGVRAVRRRVLPLVEIRMPFTVSRRELLDAERGAGDADFGALDDAARQIALAENVAVFHGWPEAGIVGITEASAHDPLPLGRDVSGYPGAVAKAVEVLRVAGVGGPYGLALGPAEYTQVVETAENGGYLLFDHLRHILGGPILRAPGVRGAVLLSQRGEDFVLDSGEDLSIGYSHHDAEHVHLYLEESFTFQVLSPDAAVALPG